MTLVIGAQSKDGIVIATDQLAMRGGEPSYSNKIFEIGRLVFALAGPTGVSEDFLLLLNDEEKRQKGFSRLYEVKVIVEDIVSELSSRYTKRLGESGGISAVMGGLSEVTRGEAQLYHILPQGYGEITRDLICIGSGSPYATCIAKFLCETKLSVMENACLAAFIVLWVSEEVSRTVGGTPQIAIIRNGNPDIEYLGSDRIQDAKQKVEQVRKNLKKTFGLEEIAKS